MSSIKTAPKCRSKDSDFVVLDTQQVQKVALS